MDDEIFYDAAQSVKDAKDDVRRMIEWMDEHASKLPHGIMEDLIANLQDANNVLPDDVPFAPKWKRMTNKVLRNANRLNDNAHRFDSHMRRDRAKELADKIDSLLAEMVG